MARASTAATRSLIALVALAAGAGAQVGSSAPRAPVISDSELSDPIAREWKLREFACDPARIGEGLEFDGREQPQRPRWVYETLARAQRAAPSEELRRLLLQVGCFRAGERADVALARVEALCAARTGVRFTDCWPSTDPSPAPAAGYEHRHALPLLRVASARWMRFEPRDELARPELLELLRDTDERVALEAWTSLALRVLEGTSPFDSLAIGWSAMLEREEQRSLVDAIVALETVRAPIAALDALASAAHGGERVWCGAIEALRALEGARPDAERMLAAWLLLDGETQPLREVFLRGARSALVRGDGLGGVAFELLARATDENERGRLLDFALEALDAPQFAALALRSNAFDEPRQAELWERFRGRSIDWTLAELEPWLDPAARALSVRLAVVEWLGAEAVAAQHASIEAALARALLDPELEVARGAFHGLCDVADPTPWGAQLHRAWLRFEDSERLTLAARLPRKRPLPEFRSDWVALGARGGEALDVVIELVTAFAPDAQLASEVERWIDATLRAWPANAKDRAAELTLAALTRAYGRLAPETSTRRLDELARWANPVSDEVGKVALFALGQSAEGRARLAHWLTEQAPSRLRIEAALMLAPHGDPRAATFLRSGFERLDLQLKARSVEALVAHGGGDSLEFLSAFALDPRAEQQLRLRALEVLSRRAPVNVGLLAATTRDASFEIALEAWWLYARTGERVAREDLRARLGQLALALEARPGADHAMLVAERAQLLRVAAELELVDEALTREWRRPLDLQAESDLRERFSAPTEPRPDFSYGAELAFGRTLAKLRQLGAALGDDPRWRRWDASVLEALGASACEEGELATGRSLLAAAHIALLGEPDGELRRNREFQMRHRSLAAAEQAGDWDACARLSAAHLDDLRTRRVGARTAERWLGAWDPFARIDGVARLECALQLALARRALASGDLLAARVHRDFAARPAERSAVAADAFERFELEFQAKSAAAK